MILTGITRRARFRTFQTPRLASAVPYPSPPPTSSPSSASSPPALPGSSPPAIKRLPGIENAAVDVLSNRSPVLFYPDFVHADKIAVDGLLQSLGLEKYLITFQVEEIDMTALMHMTDGDLKALGIPMGPRKKILMALDARS